MQQWSSSHFPIQHWTSFHPHNILLPSTCLHYPVSNLFLIIHYLRLNFFPSSGPSTTFLSIFLTQKWISSHLHYTAFKRFPMFINYSHVSYITGKISSSSLPIAYTLPWSLLTANLVHYTILNLFPYLQPNTKSLPRFTTHYRNPSLHYPTMNLLPLPYSMLNLFFCSVPNTEPLLMFATQHWTFFNVYYPKLNFFPSSPPKT